MIHEILPVGMLQCNCSIFGDEHTREAIVVDPGDNIDQIQKILIRHALTVKAIVITMLISTTSVARRSSSRRPALRFI